MNGIPSFSGNTPPKYNFKPSNKISRREYAPISGLVLPKEDKSPKKPLIISSLVLASCALVKIIADKVKSKKI